MIRVCFFGTYVLEHMNSVLKNKLEMQGVKVIECQEDVRKNIFSIFKAYVNLYKKHRKLQYDILIIPLWKGALAFPLVKLITKKPILYYAYVSPYDTFLYDRKTIEPGSIKAKLIYLFEKIAWKWSDMILKESYAEIDHFTSQFDIEKTKFRRLFISADESEFFPCPIKTPTNEFKILFFGKFIPLHGVETIVNSAKLLSKQNNIKFIFCGDGQTKGDMIMLSKKFKLSNIDFLGYVSKEKLLENIRESDVCLGIFGNTKKASYVVTNKVYQILCSQKPLITMRSSASKEIGLVDKENCVLVESNNPSQLSEAILFLKNNPIKSIQIAKNGRKLFENRLSMNATGKELLDYLKELMDN